jgi:cytochrome b
MGTREKVWDLPVRIFHWVLALSFAGAWLLSEGDEWRSLHVALGYTALGLIAFRILWGFTGTRYARFASFLYSPKQAVQYLRDLPTGKGPRYLGHNPAGGWAVYGMLILGAATGVLGYLTFNGIGGEAMEEIHEVVANAWLVLIGLHIAGVLASSFAHRQNLPLAMITGYKRTETADVSAVGSSRRAFSSTSAVAALMITAIAGFWSWALVTGGPQRPPGTDRGDNEAAEYDQRESNHDDDD